MSVTPEYVLDKVTYQNLIMYSKVVPCYDDEQDDWDESIDANNPDNFSNSADEEIIY